MLFLLDQDELHALTGRKTSRAQIDWLNAHGIPALRNAKGLPIVSRKAVEKILGGGDDLDKASYGPSPDFDALRDA
jgi:hypothetical protein